jgi:hypothetical protein
MSIIHVPYHSSSILLASNHSQVTYETWISKALVVCMLQMVNIRRGTSGGGDPPPPAPVSIEQLLMMQTQLMQQMAHTIQNNQNNPPQQFHQVRDRRGEFLKGCPPNFTHSPDPLQADDWLHAVERQLEIAQSDDREKVLYASGQLQGAALDWWESFRNGYPDANQITWQIFKGNFRSHHVPAGTMRLKRKEFLALKQGGMSVSEYRDKFTQLSRYAPKM